MTKLWRASSSTLKRLLCANNADKSQPVPCRLLPHLLAGAASYVEPTAQIAEAMAGRISMALMDVLNRRTPRYVASAENQLVKALPKLAKGAKDATLKQLFSAHLEETKGQVERLKQVLCDPRKEADRAALRRHGRRDRRRRKDALGERTRKGRRSMPALVGAALRTTSNYEIAGYEACISMANRSDAGLRDVAGLLDSESG